jgi:hypothetical protein
VEVNVTLLRCVLVLTNGPHINQNGIHTSSRILARVINLLQEAQRVYCSRVSVMHQQRTSPLSRSPADVAHDRVRTDTSRCQRDPLRHCVFTTRSESHLCRPSMIVVTGRQRRRLHLQNGDWMFRESSTDALHRVLAAFMCVSPLRHPLSLGTAHPHLCCIPRAGSDQTRHVRTLLTRPICSMIEAPSRSPAINTFGMEVLGPAGARARREMSHRFREPQDCRIDDLADRNGHSGPCLLRVRTIASSDGCMISLL